MVIREILRETIDKLKSSNIENAIFDANLIVRTVLKLSPIDMVISYNREIKDTDAALVREYTQRRCSCEPLQYILGVQEFMGLEFKVDRNVLIPRADTEILVEAVLLQHRGMNVLDICTGSGCIALSIAHFNKNAFVTGIDISEKALETASENAKNLNLSEQVKFYKADIKKDIPQGIFDIIVSNPPYIENDVIDTLQNEVKMYEPRIALDGGKDGLDFYRRIIKISPRLLQERGMLYFEVGYNQAEAVSKMMEKDFGDIAVIKDLHGVNRVVYGRKRGR